jgi:hypothetical protein
MIICSQIPSISSLLQFINPCFILHRSPSQRLRPLYQLHRLNSRSSSWLAAVPLTRALAAACAHIWRAAGQHAFCLRPIRPPSTAAPLIRGASSPHSTCRADHGDTVSAEGQASIQQWRHAYCAPGRCYNHEHLSVPLSQGGRSAVSAWRLRSGLEQHHHSLSRLCAAPAKGTLRQQPFPIVDKPLIY